MTDPPNNFEERLSNALIKLLIAGSGSSAIIFLYLNDVPKAAIAGIVALGGGLLTSFGEGLMSTLKSGFERRGKLVGKLTDEALDIGLDKAVKTITRFDKQYKEAIKTACYDLEIEGFRSDLPPLSLENIFIPIQLDCDPSNQIKKDLIRGIWELMPKPNQPISDHHYRRLAIIADPGYGKSTLMRYLAFKYSNDSFKDHGATELLPVLLVLRTIYNHIRDVQTPTLPNLIVEQLKNLPSCQHLTPSLLWFKEQLKNGKCLVMLDGLDEVPETEREAVSNWANWQIQLYSCQFIITSRPHGYDSSLFRGVQKIGILDFNNSQKEDFLKRWYKLVLWRQKWEILWQESQENSEPEQLSKEQSIAQSDQEALQASKHLMRQIIKIPALNDLAKNPLLITIIAATHRAFDVLPERKIRLYQKTFNLLLEDRPRKKIPLTLKSAEDNQVILQDLALLLMVKNCLQFTLEQVEIFLQERLSEFSVESELTPKRFLREIQEITGLLSGRESNLYQFTHKTFQEYLAAVALKQRGKIQFLIRKIQNDTWKDWTEVILFMAAMGSANDFLKAILNSSIEAEKLLLAYNITVEAKNRIDPDLRMRLEHALDEANLSGGVSTHMILQRKFQNLKFIDEKKSISEFISVREYRLFMQDQLSGQFHSSATWEDDLSLEKIDEPVSGITKSDALWFCAWLSTQANIQPETGVYDYEPCDNYPGYFPLTVHRTKIHDRYQELINYLANGRWEEADEETLKIMLEISGLQKLGWLNNKSIKEFPCQDIRSIDRLWIKFSGGKFGFSVQQKIYIETGNFLDGELRKKEFNHFYEAVGWSYCDYKLASPPGHLPQLALKRGKISALLFSCFGFFFLEGIGIPCMPPPRLSVYSGMNYDRQL